MGKASRSKGMDASADPGWAGRRAAGRFSTASCGPDGGGADALALCRVRRGARDYLLATWAAATRPQSLALEPDQRWLGLAIRATEAGGPKDQEGWVEFVARSRVRGQGVRLHERSRFRREGGRWVYVDGEFPGA